MKDLDYQFKAVKSLKEKSNELFNLQGYHTLVFKAPTGSGKTVIMAEFLKDLVSNRQDDRELSFIWTAPRKLHSQSKDKLSNHYKDSMALKCSKFEDLSDRLIDSNEILFLNWESINKAKNIYYRENEQDFYLEKVIENTKNDGRDVVLIIDESHFMTSPDAAKTQKLIAMINARLTIAVSATPANVQYDESVTVHREHVIEEEMMKKSISINPEFNNILLHTATEDISIESDAEKSTQEFVLQTALNKREELSQQYSKENSNVNPLLLIQLPDKRGDKDLVEEIIDILKDKHGITTDNRRLAIYLAENKENLATIKKNDSEVDVMIFKQAITIGWDCPRASILLLFRDWQSIIFSIQTVGRIMRMAEQKHYENDILNVGYIYTNLSDISIHQDIAGGFVTINNSRRNNDIYKEISLLSCHSLRQRERTRLSPAFVDFFIESAKELNLKNNISIDVNEVTTQLISDGIIKDSDKEVEHLIDLKTNNSNTKIIDRKINEEEIQVLFDNFSIDSLPPIYPDERSIKRINTSIYEFFKNEFPNKFDYAGLQEQMIVLHKENQQHFKGVINLAKEKYLSDVDKREKELVFDENWEIPQSVNYSENFIQKAYNLSIMQPFYENNNTSNVEKNFAKFLNNKKDEIEWWFKNGEQDGTFFAVPRKDRKDDVPFYVDWIVQFKDDRIGLFETKAGITAETAKTRAEGLAAYINEQNKRGKSYTINHKRFKGKNLFGGIVIEKNDHFWLNSNEEYEYDENDLLNSGWAQLDLKKSTN